MARIKGRPSNYRKSLQNDDDWQEVKRKVKIRDNHQCRICGCKIGLEVHHITYWLNGKSIRGMELENLEWLITLCEGHHKWVHANPNHPLNPQNKSKQNANTYRGLP